MVHPEAVLLPTIKFGRVSMVLLGAVLPLDQELAAVDVALFELVLGQGGGGGVRALVIRLQER